MNKLIIAGAGEFGRETLQWAMQSNDNNKKWRIAGFIDDNNDALKGYQCNYSILGKIDDWKPKQDERFVIAVAFPKTKKLIVEKLFEKGAIFENVIHKTVTMATNVKLGSGIIITPNAIVSDSATINDHVVILNNSTVAHDVVVGKYTTISSLCDIGGRVELEDGVFIGSSVCTIPRCKIGKNAFICAGSAVMNNIRADKKVLGIPAKKFKIGS